MKFCLFFIIFSVAATDYSFSQEMSRKDSTKQYIHYIRGLKAAKKNWVDSSIDKINYFDDTAELKMLYGKSFDSLHYSFSQRRGCISFSSGYKNPLGFLGVSLEDRLLNVNSKFQFGLGLGFSSFLGLRSSVGVKYFFVSEKEEFMPFLGVDYIYSTGNQLSSLDDQYYCTVQSHQHINTYVGLKLKPLSILHHNVADELSFKDLVDLKVIIGYTYLATPLKIDTLSVPIDRWIYPYKTIRNGVESGVYVELMLGIDIPYVKEYYAKKKLDRKGILKMN